MVTTHAPVPLHAPPQPAKSESSSPVAVSVTVEPISNSSAQAVPLSPHSRPLGSLAIRPLPLSSLPTLSEYWFAKVAVTFLTWSIVTTQGSVPLHAPPQPVKVPTPVVAVSMTTVPYGSVSLQSAPQSIPAMSAVTVPLPVPSLATVSA